jgi:ferredoxin-NADP reductase
VQQRGGRLYEIVGPRHKVGFNARSLRRLVPDIALRDVYVCGPDGFSSQVVDAALRLGVTEEQIHLEAFGF